MRDFIGVVAHWVQQHHAAIGAVACAGALIGVLVAFRWLFSGYSPLIALRYLRPARGNKLSISFSTTLALIGVTLGVSLLTTTMAVTGGFLEQFREKVLGVNSHVLVLKYSIDFREYRRVMDIARDVPGVTGVAPFVIDPMMVSHGKRIATGVLIKGVDPGLVSSVLDLPKHIVAPKGYAQAGFSGLRLPGAIAPARAQLPLPMKAPGKPDEGSPDNDPLDAPAGEQGSLMDEMRRAVDESKARKEGKPAAAKRQPPKPAPAPAVAKPHDSTPHGGFASELPDDDTVDVKDDPDPCASSSVVGLPGAIIGTVLAKQLSAAIGDCIQIMSPTVGSAYTASSRVPLIKAFRIVALFEAGFDQYDAKLIYTDLYAAQEFYEYGDSVTGVEMRIADISKSGAIKQEIERRLNNSIYHTMDWAELNHGLFSTIQMQQLLLSIPFQGLMVISGFVVVATLTMLGLEKRQEIALLKAIGATNSAIFRIFLLQGIFYGVAGASLGLGLAYLLCRVILVRAVPLDPKIYFISQLPIRVNAAEFGGVAIAAIAVCIAASIIPALSTALRRPTDGLRAE